MRAGSPVIVWRFQSEQFKSDRNYRRWCSESYGQSTVAVIFANQSQFAMLEKNVLFSMSLGSLRVWDSLKAHVVGNPATMIYHQRKPIQLWRYWATKLLYTCIAQHQHFVAVEGHAYSSLAVETKLPTCCSDDHRHAFSVTMGREWITDTTQKCLKILKYPHTLIPSKCLTKSILTNYLSYTQLSVCLCRCVYTQMSHLENSRTLSSS